MSWRRGSSRTTCQDRPGRSSTEGPRRYLSGSSFLDVRGPSSAARTTWRSSAAVWSTRPLVSLVGPGGVGKTRLALELAHELALEDRPVVWVDLSTVERGRLADLVADATGVDMPRGQDPHAALGASLRGVVRSAVPRQRRDRAGRGRAAGRGTARPGAAAADPCHQPRTARRSQRARAPAGATAPPLRSRRRQPRRQALPRARERPRGAADRGCPRGHRAPVPSSRRAPARHRARRRPGPDLRHPAVRRPHRR